MDFSTYQAAAAETAIYPNRGSLQGVMYAALGLSGEAGEVANKVKKLYRDGTLSSCDAVRAVGSEIGDVLWYAAELATQLDAYLDDIAFDNIQKLLDRKERNVIGGNGDER